MTQARSRVARAASYVGLAFGVSDAGGRHDYVFSVRRWILAGTNGDHFGGAVALEGNTMVAGAREDVPIASTQTAHGSAYVFEFNGTTWTSQGQLIANDAAGGDNFGWSVAVSDNVIAVGARGDDTPPPAVKPDARKVP